MLGISDLRNFAQSAIDASYDVSYRGSSYSGSSYSGSYFPYYPVHRTIIHNYPTSSTSSSSKSDESKKKSDAPLMLGIAAVCAAVLALCYRLGASHARSEQLSQTKEMAKMMRGFDDKKISPLAKKTFEQLIEAKMSLEMKQISDSRWYDVTILGALAGGAALAYGAYTGHNPSETYGGIALAASSIAGLGRLCYQYGYRSSYERRRDEVRTLSHQFLSQTSVPSRVFGWIKGEA